MLHSQRYHHFSKNQLSAKPLDPDKWPEEWKRVEFKAYPRLARLALEPHIRTLPAVSCSEALSRRRSARDFNGEPIGLEAIANLLFHAAGIRADGSSRPYPSGGARYPLEVYLLVLRGENDVPPGIYHYNLRENALEVLWKTDLLANDKLGEALVYPWSLRASAIVLVTAVFERNQRKYGERGYRMILQESGHLGQNLYLVSEALGLGCCALSGYIDEIVDDLLNIDGFTESTIYALAIGKREK